MKSVNKVILMETLEGSRGEVHAAGHAGCQDHPATNERFKGQDGPVAGPHRVHNVVLWQRLAEMPASI